MQIATSLHIDFVIYAITNLGNLYFLNVDIKQQNPKVKKINRYFLGTFKTIKHTLAEE